MTFRIDYSAIAFAANHGIHLFHLGGDVHLTHCCRRVNATMRLRYVSKSTSAAQVAHGVARCVGEHIVGHTDQCVFLAKHFSVFTDEGQTVYIGVNHNAKVIFSALHLVHDSCEILL